ncbi:MAG: DNA polymerase III subunit beta [Actinomycetota bacterium]
MKFRCERDGLVEAISAVGRAVSGRGSALPVLSGALVELSGDDLTLTGTDLDMTIRVRIGVDGQSDGRAVLPARLASDIIRALEPGAVTVEVDDEEARISSGRSEFAVRLLSVDDYPQVGEVDGEPVVVPAEQLAGGLSQVVRAASKDDSRPTLTGVLFQAEPGGLRLVATDSYRLAVRDLPGTSVLSEGQQVLVPGRALSELVRVLGDAEEVGLILGDREVAFVLEGVELSTRLIEGEFPNYRQLVPTDYPNELSVGREPLLDAVRRVRLLAREATPVRVGQQADSIDLTAITQDVGQAHESLDASYQGEDLVVAFNPEYLLDGVEALDGDEVKVQTRDALKPVVLRGSDPDFLYLLMPVRVS